MFYLAGPAVGLDRELYGPDGEPWCTFRTGSTECINGCRCLNPNHAPPSNLVILLTGGVW